MAKHHTREAILDQLYRSPTDKVVIVLGDADTAADVETPDTLLGPARITYGFGTFPGTTYTATVESLR